MSRVLVTGFIGQHLLAQLVRSARYIRCLVRPAERRDFVPPDGVDVALGDLTKPETLDGLIDGIDTVYHLAGETAVVTLKLYHLVNALGTRNLVDACRQSTSPPLLIYSSSISASGPCVGYEPRTESGAPRPASFYGRSKLKAERYLQTAADWLPATILRPPPVLGPGDRHVAKMMKTMRSGFNPVPGNHDLRTTWLYVDDLVAALKDAARIGRRLPPPGSCAERGQGIYFVGMDEAPPVTELAPMIADVMGSPRPRTIFVPKPLCWFGAMFNDVRARIENWPLWVSPDKMRDMLGGSWICSSDKAKRELGFQAKVRLRQSFERIFRWYSEQDWL